MTHRDQKNVASSVHARLLNKAREEGRRFDELLQYYAMERFLFRLSQSPHVEHFVLKGALLLRTFAVEQSRLTRDIDLLGYGPSHIEHLEQVVRECLCFDVSDDGLSFDPETVEGKEISRASEYQGVRIRFTGHLGNARIVMQLDIGFGDAVVPGPIRVEYPELLDFGAPRLLGYTLESAIAEKYQAMVHLGTANSRMKDFYDIWFLARGFSFNGERMGRAIAATFARRKMNLPAEKPVALTPSYADDPIRKRQWDAFLRKTRIEAHGLVLADVVRHIEAFLMPPTNALGEDRPFSMRWLPGGPWQEPA
jgi:predicted nucleotidyltransferase component of viral defense system